MSKFVNRKKRKDRTIDEVLELIKVGDTDAIIDEYIFRFGIDYCVRENEPKWQVWLGKKYSTSHISIMQKRLLK